jgi:FKBP-type peptidyl-prolyl cis-trans isomerase SlyD
MQITEDHIVGFNYTLKDDSGKLIDSSKDEPLYYHHGRGKLVRGLEKVLAGKSVGWQGSVRVSKDEGYGEYDSRMVFEVPLVKFGKQSPNSGDIVGVPNPQGGQYQARVIRKNDQKVTLDANHPLAGMELTWDVEIVSVRPARPDELQ